MRDGGGGGKSRSKTKNDAMAQARKEARVLYPKANADKEESRKIAKKISLLGTLDVAGAIASTPSGPLEVFGTPQWKMIVHEDFSPGSAVSRVD